MGRCIGAFRSLAVVAFLLTAAGLAQAQSVSLANPASYHQGDLPTACPTVTVTCAAGFWGDPSGIRIVIPPGVNMTWDTTVTSVGVTGTAQSAGHISNAPSVSYANGNRTVIVPIISGHFFAAAQTAAISGLRFANFGAPSSSVLSANWDGTDIIGANTISTGFAVTIVGNPTVNSGSNQTIDPPGPVTANNIVITDAATPGIWATTDIRITIPGSLNMTWDNSVSVVGISMSGGGVVSTSVPFGNYEDGNKTVRLNVTTDFSSGSSVTISGLAFDNIGTDSGPAQLTVTTNGPTAPGRTGNQGTDIRTKTILGLPTIASNAAQVFTKGDPSTLTQFIRITESAGTPKITAAGDIRIIIPAALNMTWDTSVGAVTVSGTAQGAGHILAAPAVAYGGVGGNKTVTIPVVNTFGSGQIADISGLRLTNFSAQSAASRLQLDINNDAVADSVDAQTIAIGAPTISSGSLQVFQVGDPPTLANPITVTDGTPARITTAGSIRLKIPAGFNMIWDTSIVTATVTGTGQTGGHISAAPAVTYEDTNQTAVLPVLSTFGAGQTAVISGLRFTNFTAPSTPNSLQLEINNLGTNCNVDAFNIAIGGIPSISSQSNQAFTVNDPATAAVQITLTDANGFPFITAANDIRIEIPAGFPMEWDTTMVSGATLTVTGTAQAAGHIAASPAFSITGSNKIITITVASDFSVSQTAIINGLRFRNFTARANSDNLLFFVDPMGSGVPDDKTIAIGRPTVALSASQTFGVGDPSTVLNTVTVTEDATVARITSANGIRLQIPAAATLDMTWDPSILSVTVTGTAQGAGHIAANPTVSYANGNKTVIISVLSSFGPGQTAIISGLRVTSFGSATGPGTLGLAVNASGTVCNNSAQTMSIGARPLLLSVATADTNGNGSIDHLVLTYSKILDATTGSATAGTGFAVVTPAYTVGAGSVTGAVLTLTLVEKGIPDTGVTPSITYDPMVGNLQDLTGLTTSSTGPMVAADAAAPVAMSITKLDSNANGHLNSVTITFSETLLAGQEDVADWKLIDADGATDLLQGLVSLAISGNAVTFTLADSFGTGGIPVYQYLPDADATRLQDVVLPANLVVTQTNASLPDVQVNSDLSVGPSKVILDASRSTDPNGQPLTFSWVHTSPFFLNNPNTATPFFLGTTEGTYTFTVTVSNLVVSKAVNVNVTILNIPPGADAGSDQTVNPGQSPVHVVALASTDANGNAVTFSWTQISGAPVVLSGPTLPYPFFVGPTPSAIAPPDNILVFEVTVSDGVNSTKSRATVRVNGLGNLAPTANAGPDQVASVGSTVQLDGSLSRDPEGQPLIYQWTSTTPMTPPAGNTFNPSFVPVLPGLYTFHLTVTDAANLSSFMSTVRVLVQSPANQAPAASAHRFQPLGEIVVGDQIVLDATGSQDPEGSPLTYAWVQTAGPTVILENPSGLRPTFTPVRAATYTFRLIVSDGVNQSLPEFVSMTVKEFPGDPTFMTTLIPGAGITAGHATMPAAFQLNIATSDPGNTYYFYLEQTAGPAAAINSTSGSGQLAFPPAVAYTVTPTGPGLCTFRLASTSFSLIRAYATLNVVVDGPAAYTTPVALASAPLTSVAGQPLTLDSAGSTGATGFYWTQLEGPPVALSNSTAAAPTVTPIAAGQYTFALTVADATSSSAPSFVVVNVSAAPAAPVSDGGSSGGCGFLGLEGLLILPLVWLLAAIRSGLRIRRAV